MYIFTTYIRKYIQMKFLVPLFAILCISLPSFSQNRIEGVVKDANNGKPLPFATIVVDKQNMKGTTTRLNGQFILSVSEKDQQLIASYMGYETKVVPISLLRRDAANNEILLTPSAFSINEVTVYPTENPAHRIIRNAIANIPLNNPDENPSYTCRIYNKTTIGIDPFLKNKNAARLKSLMDTTNLMITESVVDKSYSYKDKSKETVIANRISGFKHPLFALTNSIFQPFHFYNTYIPLFNKQLLNPISANSTKNYFFQIKDTIITGKDSTFVIEFTPRRNTNFEGFKGFIHISTQGWAIQNVAAERAINSGVNVKIEQHYSIKKGKWFPDEYRYRYELKNYPPNYGDTYYEGIGSVYDVSIARTPSKVTKSTITLADSADKAYKTIEEHRPTPLTRKDSSTYLRMDKVIAQKRNLDNIQSWIEYFGQGLLPIGPLCMPIKSLYSTNEYEKHRLGLGLETNRAISNYFKTGGYFAYGTKDAEWKYGGYLALYPHKDHITSFTYAYKKDLEMPTSIFLVDDRRGSFVNRFLLNRADKVEEHKIGVSSRTWDIDYKVAATYQHFAPMYSYLYKGVQQQEHWSNNAEISLNLRLGLKEKETRFFNLSFFDTQDYPVVGLNIRKGIKELAGDYSYLSVEGGVFKAFKIRKAGILRITALGGALKGDTPYSLLFGANGTNTGYFPFLVSNSFNCAKPFEYASDRYANLFLYYDLSSLLYNSKKFKPTVSLFQAAGWSELASHKDFDMLDVKDMRKGYFESGIIIGNVLRQKVFNVFYLGFGVGVFAAYGDAVDKPIDKTLAYKLKMEFDF